MARNASPSDLTEDQWKEIKTLVPAALPGGRHRSVDLREVLNGVLYLNRTACSWRQLPHDFPPATILRPNSPARMQAFETFGAHVGPCRVRSFARATVSKPTGGDPLNYGNLTFRLWLRRQARR